LRENKEGISVCAFQLCRDRFEEELESYSVQVEMCATFGELTDLSKYLKKSQALNVKLELAMEKVHKDFQCWKKKNSENEKLWGVTVDQYIVNIERKSSVGLVPEP